MTRRNRITDVSKTGGRRHFLLPGILSLAAVAVIAGWLLAPQGDSAAVPVHRVVSREPARAGVPAARSVAPAVRPLPASTWGLGFRAGDSLRYRFRVERLVDVALAPEMAGAPEPPSSDVEISLRGTLHVRVYEESGSHFTVGFELSRAKGAMVSSGLGGLAGSEELVEGMSGEVRARVERRGRIESLSFPESTTAMGRNQWRGLLALWQFVLDEDASRDAWEAMEEDTTGSYIASYTKERSGDRIEIRKERSGYESLMGRGEGHDEIDLAGSAASRATALIVLDPLPLSIRGEEWIRVSPRGLPQTFTSEVAYSFERIEHEREKDLATRRPLDAVGYLAATRIGDAEPVTAAPVVEVMTEEEIAYHLLEVRQAVVERGLHSSSIAAMLSLLVERMKRDPRVIEAVLRSLRAGDLDDDTAALFLSALGTAGTAPAQAGLREIFMGEGWAADRRLSAMLAFADVESPLTGVDEDLARLHEERGDLSSTALLLLTAVARRIKESDPGRYDGIEAYVHDRLLDASATPVERGTALEALGNLGSDVTSPLVEEAFGSADEDVRRAAVHAVRQTFDETAESLIAEALRVDPSEDVRVAAVEVLVERDRERGNGLLEEALRENESVMVRKAVLDGLNERSTSEARESIAWAAEHDPSGEVREHAAQVLEAQRENERRMTEPGSGGEEEA